MEITGTGTAIKTKLILTFVAFLVLMTLLILISDTHHPYGYNNVAPPFHMAANLTIKRTNLKNWSGTDNYAPVHGSKRMNLHCHHCALVTSSSHVLGIRAGKEIDSTECVIRMNDAPTLGYESDIGSRTTLRVVAHSSIYRVIKRLSEFMQRTDTNSVVIFWGPPNKIDKDSKGTLYSSIESLSRSHSHVSSFTVRPNMMNRFDELFHRETGYNRKKSHSWLSTGWFTMVIAIEVCDNIKVYGMVPPDYCIRTPGVKTMLYHYYSPREDDECVRYRRHQYGQTGSHRFITEKQVFARWAKEYNITFIHPKW
ncbi:alpha-N-acetylgalactosaminide alpha-2,6-sialyltransferase 6-like [Pholidichthys leucotaenia]